ncbi:MAG TPA: DUF1330 domain-containing protein [Myxococcota bacterium]|nr:DUF1330 domain-containing protein [Myxococcota bacterium]
MPAVQPRPEQFARFAACRPEGPLYMLNLLKFKPRAEYADGRESDLTGEQAYGLYGAAVTKLIEAMGGGPVWFGRANALMIGDGDLEWDAVGIMMYPSFEHFTDMIRSEAYQAVHVHRDAGLAHQLLIHCQGPDQAMAALTGAGSDLSPRHRP